MVILARLEWFGPVFHLLPSQKRHKKPQKPPFSERFAQRRLNRRRLRLCTAQDLNAEPVSADWLEPEQRRQRSVDEQRRCVEDEPRGAEQRFRAQERLLHRLQEQNEPDGAKELEKVVQGPAPNALVYRATVMVVARHFLAANVAKMSPQSNIFPVLQQPHGLRVHVSRVAEDQLRCDHRKIRIKIR